VSSLCRDDQDSFHDCPEVGVYHSEYIYILTRDGELEVTRYLDVYATTTEHDPTTSLKSATMTSALITVDVSGRKFRTHKSALSISPYFSNLLAR
jgi:hypothetical protein